MKRISFLLPILWAVLGFLSASAQTNKLPIAVLDLDAKGVGLEKGVADVITESVRDEFGKQKDFDLVAREKMAQLAKEKAFQLTGCTDVSCAVEIGKALNVKKMIVGSVGKLGQKYLVFLRVVDVEKESVECSEKGEGEVRVEEIPSLVPSPVRRISACLTGKPLPPETTEVKKPAIGMTFLKVNEQGYQEYKNGIDGSVMVLIPAGSFLMGSNAHADDEKPVHPITLDSFYIDKYEVTVGQFRKFVEATGYVTEAEKEGKMKGGFVPGNLQYKSDANWRNPYFDQTDNHPVVYVSWSDAKVYAAWAGKRLPTEAEWEKAARGTTGKEYPWGDDRDASKCNSSESENSGTTPVGSYPRGASPFGVMDMAGNVYEWCRDGYDKNYYQNSPSHNPIGPSSGSKPRVLRGGTWHFPLRDCRSSDRYYFSHPTYKYFCTGFRCARAVNEH